MQQRAHRDFSRDRQPPPRESLSFIVPTFREDAFGDSIQALLACLPPSHPEPVEVLVVDDSDQATQASMREEITRRFSSLEPRVSVRLIPGPHRGKGAAVRVGVLASTGSIVFLVDADLPVPLEFVAVFLDAMRHSDADVLVAERPRDRYAGKPLRKVVASSLRLIQQAVVFQGPRFDDTQCGFKAFRGPALRALAERQLIDGGMYDLEYLYAAVRRGLVVERIDVTTREEVRPTRINVLRCIVFDPIDILRLKAAGVLGRYDT